MNTDDTTIVSTRALQGQHRPMSERSVFTMQELLKLRRLTREQFARLLCVDANKSVKFPIFRLHQKGLIAKEYLPLGRKSEAIIRLTEAGHRQAAVSLGRDHAEHYRDYVTVEFVAHLLVINDLYLEIVTSGAADWAAVRYNASLFDWHASNDDTSFIWDTPGEFDRRQRRVVPDVTIETETTRYLLEVERPTKTLSVVARKIDQYSDLFSPLRSTQDRSGYAQKYPDGKRAVVVFVFTDERRAANARAIIERKAKASAGFHIAHWKCGAVAGVATELRQELLGRPAAPQSAAAQSAEPRREDLLSRYGDAVYKFVLDATARLTEVRAQVEAGKPVALPAWPATLNDMKPLLRELKSMRAGGAS